MPFEERGLTKQQAEKADTLVLFNDEVQTGSVEAIRQFLVRGAALKSLGDNDKRSLENGVKILKAYFKQYLDDGLEVMRDTAGNPLVEKEVRFKLYEDELIEIEYFGTIDAVMKSTFNDMPMVCDHKTTAALGSQFYNRIKPNHQYTGYLLAARQCLGIDTNLFMVNGIQVAKTKCEFARQVTERSEEDFQEFSAAVIAGVKSFLDAYNSGNFPQHAPNSCSNYGSCPYLDVCSAPSSLRENIISAKFSKGVEK